MTLCFGNVLTLADVWSFRDFVTRLFLATRVPGLLVMELCRVLGEQVPSCANYRGWRTNSDYQNVLSRTQNGAASKPHALDA